MLLRLVLLAVMDVCYEEFKKATIVLQTLQEAIRMCGREELLLLWRNQLYRGWWA